MWIYEELQLYNSLQKGQKKSRVDHLREIAAFPEKVFAAAVDELENRPFPHVVAFFQLPKPIFVGHEVFSLPAKEHRVIIDFQFTPIEIDIDLAGQPKCVVDIGQAGFRPNATQVCAFVPIWQKRAQYFPRYERCFGASGMTNDIVIHGHESWIDGRPFRAVDFENNIFSRVIREIQFAIKLFLKSYSTTNQENFLTDDWLYSYFIMPYPWRLSYGSPPVPVYKYFIDSYKRGVSKVSSKEYIDKGVVFSSRNFSRFEKQIFLLSNMAREGNYAISIVTGLSLVEWILKMNAKDKEKN